MDGPARWRTDLELLTAAVVANPDDVTAWAMYSDCCRDLGNDEWADLAQEYMAADAGGRILLVSDRWEDWSPATEIVYAMVLKALPKIGEAAASMIEAFRSIGTALEAALGPALAKLARIGRGMEATTASPDPSPPVQSFPSGP